MYFLDSTVYCWPAIVELHFAIVTLECAAVAVAAAAASWDIGLFHPAAQKANAQREGGWKEAEQNENVLGRNLARREGRRKRQLTKKEYNG